MEDAMMQAIVNQYKKMQTSDSPDLMGPPSAGSELAPPPAGGALQPQTPPPQQEQPSEDMKMKMQVLESLQGMGGGGDMFGQRVAANATENLKNLKNKK